MSGLVVRNLSGQLVELVRDRILSGAMPANLALRQDALAAELGVSKIPLRAALTRLEQEGLLRSLLQSWLARDAERIAQLMAVHISETLADLRKQLATQR